MFDGDQSPNKKAQNAIALIKTLMIANFIHLIDDGALPKHVSSKAWDTLAVVAGSYAIMAYLKGSNGSDYAIYGSPLISTLDTQVHQGQAALEDCVEFVGKMPPEQIESTLGYWLLWNLLGRRPEYEEGKYAGVIGGMVRRLAIEAWKSSAR